MADTEGTQVLASQGGLTFLGNILGRVLGFLYLAAVTRLVEPELFGLFSLGLAVVVYIQGLADLNLNRAVSYFVPSHLDDSEPGRAASVLRTSITLALASSVLLGGLVVLTRGTLAAAFEASELSLILPALALVLPLRTLDRLLLAVFDASKKLQYRVLSLNVVQPVSKITASVGLLLLGYGVGGLIAGYLAALVLSVVTSTYFLVSRLSWPTARPVTSSRSKLLSYSLPLMFAGLFYTVTSQMDYFAIGYFSDPSSVAIYRVGFLLAGNIMVFGHSMQPILKPLIVEARSDRGILRKRYQTATRWVLLLTLPPAITLLIAPRTYLSLLFTSEYAGATTATALLIVGYVISAHLGTGGIVLEGLGFSRLRFVNAVLLVLVNGVLDILLVPRFGIAGAGAATAIALTATGVAANAEVFYLRGIFPYSWSMRYVVAASTVALSVAFALAKILGGGLALALALPPIVLSTYLLVLLVSGGFTEADREAAQLVDDRIGTTVFQRLMS